ncbi:MAG: formate dehydrogenase subunit gamma [Limimaricola sp.]|uniref:formate dehydrogenase subunit gamma n=1 Tax=Limimaricola sp. TaxID=2211665 RepID=UPI001D70ED86|nr:formate dehydrogenase subunit gamma [Limimaricola sp.]MBI1417567.1 formate dehydrogenase subunit gamma [Limimaricola sp.]
MSSAALDQHLDRIFADLGALEGPLLPILHALQADLGHVPKDALPLIAERLNITRAEVHGVVSFYHDFREEPAGRHVVKLCRAEACQAMGANRVADHARAALGVDWHETTPDGVTLEPVFCLGLCACGPAALVDGEVVGRVDEARFDTIVDGFKAKVTA